MTAVPYCFSKSQHLIHRCLAGLTWLAITPDGSVKICGHSYQKIGNMKESSMKQIWEATRGERSLDFLPTGCKSCPNSSSICTGGCKMIASVHGKDSDPLVDVSLGDRPEDIPIEDTYESNMFGSQDARKPIDRFSRLEFSKNVRHREESFGGILYWNAGLVVNETGYEIVKMVESGMNMDSMAKRIEKDYGIEYETASKDIENFILMLNKLNVIKSS
jgi:radical SAM protein with 4Fe4S-binding SPASM domain